MPQVVFEVIESAEGGFEASARGHRIRTQDDTWTELTEMVQDAVRAHFEEGERPAIIRFLVDREAARTA